MLTSDYNNIGGGAEESWFGDNSFAVDPQFTDENAGNYTLSPYSILIGAGTANFDNYSAPTKDISGTVRLNPSGSTVDIGAFESTLGSSPVPAAPADLAASAGNGQVVTVDNCSRRMVEISDYSQTNGWPKLTAGLEYTIMKLSQIVFPESLTKSSSNFSKIVF